MDTTQASIPAGVHADIEVLQLKHSALMEKLAEIQAKFETLASEKPERTLDVAAIVDAVNSNTNHKLEKFTDHLAGQSKCALMPWRPRLSCSYQQNQRQRRERRSKTLKSWCGECYSSACYSFGGLSCDVGHMFFCVPRAHYAKQF